MGSRLLGSWLSWWSWLSHLGPFGSCLIQFYPVNSESRKLGILRLFPHILMTEPTGTVISWLTLHLNASSMDLQFASYLIRKLLCCLLLVFYHPLGPSSIKKKKKIFIIFCSTFSAMKIVVLTAIETGLQRSRTFRTTIVNLWSIHRQDSIL